VGLLFVPLDAQGKYPVIWTPNKEFTGGSVKLAVETKDVEALIAYVQKLGMNRGKWRDLFEPQEMDGAGVSMPRSQEWIEHGKEVYERRCLGCHGAHGDGNGPAATFMYKQRPRIFSQGVFKFRLTESSLPTDGDLLRTITRGVRGTAMPPWYDLPLNDRLAVIQYIKYVLAVDRSSGDKPVEFFADSPGEPLYIPPPPAPSSAMIAHGKDIWAQAKCWECHGETGKGDGQKAAGLTDDPGFPIRPANLRAGQFKSGSSVTDIFRTISRGLSGTPMPSYGDAFPDADRWALAYYILSLSAFTDPLRGEPLTISAADRAALDNPKLQAPSPEQAYGLLQP
jgi:cytochrome c oxidase cbb3-type subunit I/II